MAGGEGREEATPRSCNALGRGLGFLRKPSKNFKRAGVMECFKNLPAMQSINCKNENVETCYETIVVSRLEVVGCKLGWQWRKK